MDTVTDIIDKEFYSVREGHIYDNIIHYIEKIVIMKALERLHGNKVQAAKLLGLNRNTLHSKIKKFDIDVESFKR